MEQAGLYCLFHARLKNPTVSFEWLTHVIARVA